MVSLSGIVWLIVKLLAAGLIFYLLDRLIDKVVTAEPYRHVAKIVLYVLGVLFLIGLLLPLAGGPDVIVWR